MSFVTRYVLPHHRPFPSATGLFTSILLQSPSASTSSTVPPRYWLDALVISGWSVQSGVMSIPRRHSEDFTELVIKGCEGTGEREVAGVEGAIEWDKRFGQWTASYT